MLLIAVSAAAGATNAAAAPAQVTDGSARFQIITPTLLRLEYAADGVFENRATQTLGTRGTPVGAFSTSTAGGVRTIRTSALTLRYTQGSGPFTDANLSITLNVSGKQTTARPVWRTGDTPGNLGGWRRGLDLLTDRAPLHDGVLSRDGWYLLNDSETALAASGSPGFTVRPRRTGAYQDGYFFGYGHDYARGLADLRTLTGAAPLLPRKAFGVWFSRYWGYTEQELRQLVARFRSEGVPLDTLSLDTDFKRQSNNDTAPLGSAFAGGRPEQPFAWNGWDWNRNAFKDPKAFADWAHSQGIALALNIHPSIGSTDPAADKANTDAGGLIPNYGLCNVLMVDFGQICGVFDWTNPKHIATYFALHKPFEDAGADVMWLDWCCDASRAEARGLTADTQINRLYAERSAARGSRWPAFSRIGGAYRPDAYQSGFALRDGNGAFAEHRYTIQFTGDTCASWQMLGFNAEYSAVAGNIGLPYVSHDIGSFHGVRALDETCGPAPFGLFGKHLPDDLYTRWVQLGTFQPLDRLHSNHGDRLPWEYGGKAGAAAADALRLRGALVPYLYNLAREAHDTGLPMTRPLYLQWPDTNAAYEHPTQYTLGSDILVAPVTTPGDPATSTVWIPPGAWTNIATGARFTGPTTVTLKVPLEQIPVFARDGAIVPFQGPSPTSSAGPNAALGLDVWPGARGAFSLYEDDGQSLAYQQPGASRRTAVEQRPGEVTIRSATGGSFAGALNRRSWTLRIHNTGAVGAVTVNGTALPPSGWQYDAATKTLTVRTGTVATNVATRVQFH